VEPAVHLQVLAVPGNVAVCRNAVLGLCSAIGLDRAAKTDVGLAVTEACTNAVLHAYDADAREPTLEVDAYENDDLTVVVRDAGRGLWPTGGSPGGGMGLRVIAAVTRRMALRAGPGGRGTEVVMHFNLPHKLAAPAPRSPT
jgi:anti-sigma regulatory factor (Ser/Thr protein kinase)